MPNTLLRTSALVWTKQRMARGMFVLMHSPDHGPSFLSQRGLMSHIICADRIMYKNTEHSA